MTVPQPPNGSPRAPRWLAGAFGKGPIIGALIAGFMVWLPSRSAGALISTAILMFVIVVGLRVLDPYLGALWRSLGRVPRLIRIAAGIGLPFWYSVSQFGPSASGREVATVRNTLIVTAILAFVLFHPAPESPAPTAQ